MRIVGLFFFLVLPMPGQTTVPPDSSILRSEILGKMDRAILRSIRSKRLPGGVLWLERQEEVYRKAYGKRATVPASEAMTVDTIFDAASLTKVIATTPCILKLIEENKLSLKDKASRFLPELTGDPNKATVTIRHLLTHASGLLPGIRRGYDWQGHAAGIALVIGENFLHYFDVDRSPVRLN